MGKKPGTICRECQGSGISSDFINGGMCSTCNGTGFNMNEIECGCGDQYPVNTEDGRLLAEHGECINCLGMAGKL
jgi:DnaJ-class molecular chaperone